MGFNNNNLIPKGQDLFVVRIDKTAAKKFNELCLSQRLSMAQQVTDLAERMILEQKIPFPVDDGMIEMAKNTNGETELMFHMPLKMQDEFIAAARKAGITRHVATRLYILMCAKRGELL